MNVLCIIDSLGSGGAQRQLVNLARGLRERRHGVVVYTYHPHRHFAAQDELAGCEWVCEPKKSRYSWLPVRHIRALVKSRNITHVIAFLEVPAIYADIATLFIGNVKLVVSARNSTIGRPRAFDVIEHALHARSDKVVANSYTQRDWICKWFPWLRKKTTTIWNGVDITTFSAPADRRACGEGLRLLGVGRISPQKNLVTLVAALGDCLRKGLKVSIDWAGRIDDIAYHDKVSEGLADQSIGLAWRWLGERVNMQGLYESYDAVILPSYYEGLPNVICESLATGTPVLVSDVSDNGRLVLEGGRRGILFNPVYSDSISRAITEFAALSHEDRRTMSNDARLFARRRLSQERCVTEFEALLLSL